MVNLVYPFIYKKPTLDTDLKNMQENHQQANKATFNHTHLKELNNYWLDQPSLSPQLVFR